MKLHTVLTSNVDENICRENWLRDSKIFCEQKVDRDQLEKKTSDESYKVIAEKLLESEKSSQNIIPNIDLKKKLPVVSYIDEYSERMLEAFIIDQNYPFDYVLVKNIILDFFRSDLTDSKKQLAMFLDNCKKQYLERYVIKFFLKEAVNIIYLGVLEENSASEKLCIFLDTISENILNHILQNGGNEMLGSVLMCNKQMYDAVCICDQERKIFIEKITLLSDYSSAFKNFLKEKIAEYFTNKEIEQYFMFLPKEDQVPGLES
jgi:hypothetical protein